MNDLWLVTNDLLIGFWKRFEAWRSFDSLGVFDLESFIASIGGGLREDAGGPRNPMSQVAFVARAFAPEHNFDPRRVSPALSDAESIQRPIAIFLMPPESRMVSSRAARPVSFADAFHWFS
jgi:hypothetical protein